jgi:hypothetical protein
MLTLPSCRRRYSRSFKSGLFNPVVLPGAPIDKAVDPETLDAYTVGLKSEYLQHRLRVNAEGLSGKPPIGGIGKGAGFPQNPRHV